MAQLPSPPSPRAGGWWRVRWLQVLAALFGMALLAVLAFRLWLPDEAELARRVEAEAGQRLGVPVTVGALHWGLLPRPEVVLERVATDQAQPITIGRLRARPRLASFWAGTLAFERVDIEDAVVPQLALRAFRGKNPQGSGADAPGAVPLESFTFRRLRWIERHGRAVDYEGEIDFDAGWRPRRAVLQRPGVQPAARLSLQREPGADRWQVQVAIGGGSIDGTATLEEVADGVLLLRGQLAPQGVELVAALQALERSSPVAGKASGRTSLEARGRTAGELARSLQTRTDFSVQQARVLRFDLDKAVRSLGRDRAGQTPLEALSGRMETQNTEDGQRVRFTGLQARAGAYSAKADATLYKRQVQAEGSLVLPGGVVDLPFTVSGPVQQPELSLPKGFLAGAAAGTAVLPGVGTVIGARIGAAIGKLFGSEPGVKPPAAPKTPPRRPAPARP